MYFLHKRYSRQKVERGGGWGQCLMGAESPFGKMRIPLQMNGGDGHTTCERP